MSSLAQNRDTEGSKSPSQDAGDFVHVQVRSEKDENKIGVWVWSHVFCVFTFLRTFRVVSEMRSN